MDDKAILEAYYAAVSKDIFDRSKAAIIKTIEQELWPRAGQFDKLDQIMDEFEEKIRAAVFQ